LGAIKWAAVGAKKRAAIRKDVDKALPETCNDPQGWSSGPPRRAGVVCRSLERTTTLGFMEDHNRLLHPADSGSGLENDALPGRGVLATICVLVALCLLLCAGKAAGAEQPWRAPEHGARATSPPPASRVPERAPTADRRVSAVRPSPARRELANPGPASRSAHQRPLRQRSARERPAGHRLAGAPNADRRALVARSRPVSGRRVDRRPLSRSLPQRPEERGARAVRRSLGRPAEHPGRRISMLERPAREPRGPGPRRPVGQDTVRPHRQPVEPRPTRARPTPQTVPASSPRDSAGRPENAGSQGQLDGHGQLGQQGGPANSPGKVKTRPGPGSPVEASQHEGRPSEQGAPVVPVAGKRPEKETREVGYGGTIPEKGPIYKGRSTGAPAGLQTRPPPDHRPSAQMLAGGETVSGSAKEPLLRPEQIKDKPHGAALHGRERSAGLDRPSFHPPGLQVVKASQATGTVHGTDKAVATPPYGEQRQVLGPPFWSTRLLLGSLWNEGVSPVAQAREMLRSLQNGAGDLPAGARYAGSLTRPGVPLKAPLPFSGSGPVAGSAATGVGFSGAGSAPLLAVVICCLCAIVRRSLSRAYSAFLRPGTVPRLALERPG